MEGNAGEGGSCCYIEAGGGRWFCDGSLDWRDVYISSYSLGGSGTSQGHAHGGSYYFTHQPHRAIYWRANVGTLELIEISMNKDLVGNAIKIHLPQGAGLILSDVGVAELTSHLVIMFATSVTVYRLILPHPEVVAKDSSLSRVGRGYPPSILMFVLNDTITHHPIVEPPSSVPASCVHACCHGDGSCTFVIGTRDSNDTLHSITIPAIGSSILLPARSIMTQHGVIQKLWNILPSVSGRKSGASGDGAGVVSLTGHSFGGEFIVVSIAADGIMRLWSIQQQSCVLEHDLSSYITSSYSKESHIFIKKSATTSESSIRLALSSSIHDVLQVDIFELILLDDQLMLDHIITKSLSINSDDILLKDKWIFDVSLSEVVLWVGVANRDGDLCDIFTCKYDDEVGDEMRRCDLRSLRSHDVSLSSHCDPRESFLHLLFSSGDITTSAIMKGLMLYGFKCNSADSIDVLRRNVICKVEDEVRGVAGSCELDHHEYTQLLIKCWNKFYNCCQQYEQLLWKPLGLSHDDGTGLVSLIHGGSLSFLAPYHGTTPTDSLWEAVELVRKELSDEVLQSYIDIMESSSFSLSSLLNHDIKDEIRKLCSVMDADGLMMDRLHGYIRSIDIKEEESHDQEMMSHDPSLLDSLPDASAFFKLVVSTLRQVCLKRLKLCRDLLIICHVIQSFNIIESTQLKHYIDKLCNLSNNYHIIYWMCNYNCALTTSSRSSLLSGVLQLVEMPDPSTVNNTNILLLYLINNSHTLYTKIFSRYIERDHLHWDNLLPWLLDGLLLHLWPRDNVVLLYEMFLSCYQYGGLHILHDHCQKLDRSKAHQDGGTHLLMGYACIGLGLIDDSIKHFIDGGREMTTSAGADDGYMDGYCMDEVYWVKIMRLYEGVESSEGVVRIALYGVTECCHDDEVSSLMWSNIFKHSLIIKDHTLSYHSILNNPDQIKAKECLRHFITILVEWEWFDVICQYMYHMYEEEVESVLLAMARSSDPFTSPYYDILYSFHMERSNYWKGAQVKYEHGYRAGNERPDFDGITQQCNCYVVSWSLLNIVDNKHQWIISASDSKMKIITKSELDKECHLLKAKLSLMEINQSLSHHLCGIHVKVKEVIMLLTQSGMIDRAIRLSNVYRMSCVPIMEEVTARCISLSSNVFQQMNVDTPSWAWLDYNDCKVGLLARHSSVVERAWLLLRGYLLTPSEEESLLLATVARKLISCDVGVPQWIIGRLKVIDPASLLKIYLSYDKLEPAVTLSVDYLNAIMKGDESFDIPQPLYGLSKPIWCPHNLMDQLLTRLPEELHQKLSDELQQYFTELNRCCNVNYY